MKTKLIAWGLLAALLTGGLGGCTQEDGKTETTTTASGAPAEPTIVTIVRVKTPQLPFNIEHGDPNGGQSGFIGEGIDLGGYEQLLEYIDRGSIYAPAGWGNHPVEDMFDGLFETTAQGSNKYGTGMSALTIEWQFTEPKVVNAYTIVTANDTVNFPDRNPQRWILTASNDGERWVTLDRVDNANLPAENYTPTTFYTDNNRNNAYRYYRWEIQSTVGGQMFQVSELLLYSKK